MSSLTYEELEFPNFVNTHPAIEVNVATKEINPETKEPTIKTIVLHLSDVSKASMIAGVPFLNIGDTRCGKSRMMRDIHQWYLGGDADTNGKSNWNVARNDFTADGYFMTIDQSKLGEGRGILSDARVPVESRVQALCNMVDEINLALPEVQIEFFGMGEGKHKGLTLGNNGYYIFITSCNLNRVNGDFAGTSQINRALLNRIGVTIDHDYYKITDADLDLILSRQKNEGLRDISEKILEAHGEIKGLASKKNPFLDTYLRIFSSGLDYCDKDNDKTKKRAWPTKCGNCNFGGKDLCSLVKQSNTGTIELLKKFALGINSLIGMKYPEMGITSIDPFDLAMEAFKFTTYHGNLNGMETLSTYAGEDQDQMAEAVRKIRGVIEPLRSYIEPLIGSAMTGELETRFLVIKGEPIIYSLEDEEKCKKKKVSYNLIDSTEKFNNFGQQNGIRMDWLPVYLQSIAKEAEQK
jgi:hypothetical protein